MLAELWDLNSYRLAAGYDKVRSTLGFFVSLKEKTMLSVAY